MVSCDPQLRLVFAHLSSAEFVVMGKPTHGFVSVQPAQLFTSTERRDDPAVWQGLLLSSGLPPTTVAAFSLPPLSATTAAGFAYPLGDEMALEA